MLHTWVDGRPWKGDIAGCILSRRQGMAGLAFTGHSPHVTPHCTLPCMGIQHPMLQPAVQCLQSQGAQLNGVSAKTHVLSTAVQYMTAVFPICDIEAN